MSLNILSFEKSQQPFPKVCKSLAAILLLNALFYMIITNLF